MKTCTIDGCERKHKAHGWCNAHYQTWRVHGDPLTPDQRLTGTVCKVEGCEDRVRSRGYCRTHYDRWRKGHPIEGRPEPILRCRMDNCWNRHHTRGLCQRHYRRWVKYDDPWFNGRDYPECKIEGCYKPVGSRGWCHAHYVRWRKHGHPLAGMNHTVPMGVDLPVAPLLEVVMDRGGINATLESAGLVHDSLEWNRIEKYLTRARDRRLIDLAHADHFAIRVLGTHPALIWGDDYWASEAHEIHEIDEIEEAA